MNTKNGIKCVLGVLFAVMFFVVSVCAYADVIDLLPKTAKDKLDLIDREAVEKAKKRAESDSFYATLFYFMGADEEFYAGSIFLDAGTLSLVYWPPGQEAVSENGSCVMAYTVNAHNIQLIIKRWNWVYADEERDAMEKDIVYYRIVITEKDGKIDYTCVYTTPELDLNDYIINTAFVVDENVYAYSAPSFSSKKIAELKKGAIIPVLPTRLAENGPEAEPYDFWYKIKLPAQEAWVYGYFIHFADKVLLSVTRR